MLSVRLSSVDRPCFQNTVSSDMTTSFACIPRNKKSNLNNSYIHSRSYLELEEQSDQSNSCTALEIPITPLFGIVGLVL